MTAAGVRRLSRQVGEAVALAPFALPTRAQALSQLLGVLKAPIQKLVGTIAAPNTKLVRTIAAVAAQKGDAKPA